MFERIYETDENGKIISVEGMNVYANAIIAFDFELDELDKVQEIYKKIKDEINLCTHLKISSYVKRPNVNIVKKGDAF